MVDFEYTIFDVPKVDTDHNVVTLDMSFKMSWNDGRLSCHQEVNEKISSLHSLIFV